MSIESIKIARGNEMGELPEEELIGDKEVEE